MKSSSTLFAGVASLFAGAAAIVACSAAPSETAREQTVASDQAYTRTCPPLQSLDCSGSGSPIGGKTASIEHGELAEGALAACSCISVTGAATPGAWAPVPNVCAPGATGAATEPVPSWLAPYGCTVGLTYPVKVAYGTGVASVWACPAGTPAIPPAYVTADAGPNEDAGPHWTLAHVVTWAYDTQISNSCLGNPIPGWALVEIVHSAVTECTGPACPSPGACTGGCPIL